MSSGETDSLLALVAEAPDLDPAGDALIAGRRLDRYLLRGRLGAGSYGVVYEAEDTELGRRVALKVLREDWRGDARALARLRQEAITVARLNHPNIVVLYDHGAEGGIPFLVFELLDGMSLREWLAATRRAPAEIVAAFRDAARGLAAAHREGLIHRDFKPANVLMGKDGKVRVADFGLARDSDKAAAADAAGAPTATTRAGTPRYLSPEARRGEPVGPRADQYAFFVALDEALRSAGRIPRRLRALIARGLAADPRARHPSMDAVVAALRPPARLWPWLPVALGVAALAWTALAPGRRADPCVIGAAELHGALDEELRDRVRPVFAGAERQYLRWLELTESYGARWLRSRQEACRATRVVGDQSEHVLDLRVACLDNRRESLAGLTRTVAAGGVEPALALRAAGDLPAVDACDDVTALLAPDPPPADPRRRAEIAAVRRLVDRILMLVRIARPPGAAFSAFTVAWAGALGDPQLEGEALYARGWILERADAPAAEAALRRGLERAIAANDLRLAGRIMTYLIVVVGRVQGRWEEAESWGELALAVTRKWNAAPRAEAIALNFLALVASARGDPGAALAQSTQALAVDARMQPRDPSMEMQHWNTRAGIARTLDDDVEAARAYGIALALAAALPDQDAMVLTVRSNLGGLALDDGRVELAVQLLTETHEGYRRRYGDADMRTHVNGLSLALALAAHGEGARALAQAATALAALEGMKLGRGELHNARRLHAEVLWLVPGHADEARRELTAVLASYVADVGRAHVLTQETRVELAVWTARGGRWGEALATALARAP